MDKLGCLTAGGNFAQGIAASVWINSTSSPPPASTISADLTVFVFGACMTTLRPNFSESSGTRLQVCHREREERLRSVVQGYFNYHAVPGNLASLRSFRLQVIRRWMRALRHRSQKSRMTRPRLVAIAERWLPKPNIIHPYPNLRFDAQHPR